MDPSISFIPSTHPSLYLLVLTSLSSLRIHPSLIHHGSCPSLHLCSDLSICVFLVDSSILACTHLPVFLLFHPFCPCEFTHPSSIIAHVHLSISSHALLVDSSIAHPLQLTFLSLFPLTPLHASHPCASTHLLFILAHAISPSPLTPFHPSLPSASSISSIPAHANSPSALKLCQSLILLTHPHTYLFLVDSPITQPSQLISIS